MYRSVNQNLMWGSRPTVKCTGAFNFENIDCNSLKQSSAPISFLKMESVG